MSKRTTPEAPAPTNPPWVRFAVIGLVLLIWGSTIVNIVSGEPWTEAVLWAVIGTICLSAVDITIGRRAPKP